MSHLPTTNAWFCLNFMFAAPTALLTPPWLSPSWVSCSDKLCFHSREKLLLKLRPVTPEQSAQLRALTSMGACPEAACPHAPGWVGPSLAEDIELLKFMKDDMLLSPFPLTGSDNGTRNQLHLCSALAEMRQPLPVESGEIKASEGLCVYVCLCLSACVCFSQCSQMGAWTESHSPATN